MLNCSCIAETIAIRRAGRGQGEDIYTRRNESRNESVDFKGAPFPDFYRVLKNGNRNGIREHVNNTGFLWLSTVLTIYQQFRLKTIDIQVEVEPRKQRADPAKKAFLAGG